MRALASGGEKTMKVGFGNVTGIRKVGMGIGAMLISLLFMTGIVSAGSYNWVYVDGNSILNGGKCSTLSGGSDVFGSYSPSAPWQATLDWRLDSVGTWHAITTFNGANGALGFRFTVTDTPSGSDTLRIRAYDTDTSPPSGPYYWTCTQQ